jgi:hypothetical protein
MFKWITLILTFVMGRLNSHAPQMSFNLKDSAMGIFDDITFKSRKAVSLLLVALASVIFICGGFFISLIDATRQYDAAGVITFSSTFLSGLVLALVAVGVFTWVFASAWPGVKLNKSQQKEEALRPPPPPPQPPSSIEHAVTALIMDFIHEREHRREAQGSHTNTSGNPTPPRPRDSAFNEEIPPVYPH